MTDYRENPIEGFGEEEIDRWLGRKNAALLAALRPFAVCAAVWDETDSDRVVYWARRGVEGEPDLKLTVGDLLRAAAAIAKAEGGKG